jgi:hypothetical protein
MDDIIALHVIGATGARNIVDIKVGYSAGNNVHALVVNGIMDKTNI